MGICLLRVVMVMRTRGARVGVDRVDLEGGGEAWYPVLYVSTGLTDYC